MNAFLICLGIGIIELFIFIGYVVYKIDNNKEYMEEQNVMQKM